MSHDELLIDVLRAAGHADAAGLVEKLNAATTEKAAPAEAEEAAPAAVDNQAQAIAAALKTLTPWHAGGSL